MEISSDNFVRLGARVGNPARDLFHVELTTLIEIQAKNLIL
jgi:hypothetical protein